MDSGALITRMVYSEQHVAQTQCRSPDGAEIWSAVHPIEDFVRVNAEANAVSVNDGPWVKVPGRISRLHVTNVDILVTLYADSQVGGRNIFLYDRFGERLWQVGARDHLPQAMFLAASVMPNGNVVGYALTNGFAAEIDRGTGHVLRVFPYK
jgi:hypothetical protein